MLDNRTAPYAALILRLVLGGMFIAHLYWKFEIFPGGLPRWWSNFATNGYPWITPWYSISAEFVGAALIIPGIYARWASLYAIPLMLGSVQYWLVRKGFYFTAAGAQMPLVWAAMLFVLAMLGDGPFALKSSVMPWERKTHPLEVQA